MSLKEYAAKRDFSKTPEPSGAKGRARGKEPLFVVQEHWASHHHFDFRLEAFGTLKSWAVPKGPSPMAGDKRLAVEVEDHPIDYAKFHGRIPEGEYGAGTVRIWDEGHWIPPEHLKADLKKGHLEFELRGKKLTGKWLLQRTGRASGKKSQWLLIKRHEPVEVQLATLVDHVPRGPQWIHEIKWDGYRTIARVEGKDVRLFTRNHLDWTNRYKPLDAALKKLKIENAVFDGEVVALDEKGRSSFAELQKALKVGRSERLRYFIFDLLSLNGEDLRGQPLLFRKKLLKEILKTTPSKQLRFSAHRLSQGEKFFERACKGGLEGIVSKDKTQRYRAGRSRDWLKIKCALRQEFVIGGYTDPQGQRSRFGALLLGVQEEGKLKYVGKVGTGFDRENLKEVHEKLLKLCSGKNPFQIHSPRLKGVHWVKPRLVAEVSFRSWTPDGLLRQASFQGLREDKSPADVKDEGFRITHPGRVLYPQSKITKADVANYYRSVAPWLLAHLRKRPLSLVRCPQTAGKDCFFQKHLAPSLRTDQVRGMTAKAPGEKAQRVNYVESVTGLLQLIQTGVVELHTWQTHAEHVTHPDQVVFDLDPGPSVSWSQVLRTAERLRKLLKKLELKCFVKTTGGKGLHVHVPIAPVYAWDQVKEFSKSVVKLLQEEFPKDYTVTSSKKSRGGKIFLDYLRNDFGATAVVPYSLRAKDAPFVATPLRWSELKKIKGASAFDLEGVLKRLAKSPADPWPEFFELKQKISVLKQKKNM